MGFMRFAGFMGFMGFMGFLGFLRLMGFIGFRQVKAYIGMVLIVLLQFRSFIPTNQLQYTLSPKPSTQRP